LKHLSGFEGFVNLVVLTAKCDQTSHTVKPWAVVSLHCGKSCLVLGHSVQRISKLA